MSPVDNIFPTTSFLKTLLENIVFEAGSEEEDIDLEEESLSEEELESDGDENLEVLTDEELDEEDRSFLLVEDSSSTEEMVCSEKLVELRETPTTSHIMFSAMFRSRRRLFDSDSDSDSDSDKNTLTQAGRALLSGQDSLCRCCCGATGRRSYSVLSRQQRAFNGPGSKSVTATDSQSAPSHSDRGDSSVKGQKSESSYITPDIMETRLGATEKTTTMSCISCLHREATMEQYVVTGLGNHHESDRNLHNNISNSSLQDVDHAELQKELELYMQNISKRYHDRYN
ncbi:uncharacterized protein LOC128989090 [Macrosteles quadrilineatus]|uniref:uncharacterized protein LOC128989090 n=1 Tax=Macrosteles quadrilineatus TaxID=74068 RepID=UPI0023E0A0DD|nr:uncharacterized protein LOC128989090 [Macrosteles quadrilineatus]